MIKALKAIRLALEPFFPAAEGKQWKIDKVLLIDRVETLKFSYFGIASLDREAFWHDDWIEQRALPELIKISISLEGNVVWPEIVVVPRIEQINSQNSNDKDNGANKEDDKEF